MTQACIFNFNNYIEQPLVKYCFNNNIKKLEAKNCSVKVYTLEDVLPIIRTLRHSNYFYRANKLSFVVDQLRLKLASECDDFLYLDGDVFLVDLDKILSYPNCTEIIIKGALINNGTYFHSQKDCEFNKYYFDLYQNNTKSLVKNGNGYTNYEVFFRFPYFLDQEKRYSGDMKLLDENKDICFHMLISKLRLFLNKEKYPEEILYTFDPDFTFSKDGKPVWKLSNVDTLVAASGNDSSKTYFFDMDFKYIPRDIFLELFKAQLEYMSGKHIDFKEI